VPGYLFCDRHIAWSTRKRKPRASSKPKAHGSGVLEPTAIAQEFAEDHGPTQRDDEVLSGSFQRVINVTLMDPTVIGSGAT
jgi:hypothetical protein